MRGMVSKVTDRALRGEISRAYRDRFHLGNIFRVAIAKSALSIAFARIGSGIWTTPGISGSKLRSRCRATIERREHEV